MVENDEYGPDQVNVTDQRLKNDSLLNWMERLIRSRKECPEFGWGECRVIETTNTSIFAHRCDWSGSTVLVIHNLSASPAKIILKLDDMNDFEGLVNLLGNREYSPQPSGSLSLDLDAYGYRWFRMHRRDQRILP